MTENSFFAFMSRMKSINRWGLMRNTRYESLAEHSFETAYIAGALANIENTRYGGSYDTERITVCALYHDCPEIITGDMPTPVKYKTGRMKDSYDAAEQSAKQVLLDSLTPELAVIYKKYLDFPDVHDIVKAADKISALIKCIEEREVGNRDFSSAEQTIRASLEKSPLKSVGYFLENILPAYSMTLDELSNVIDK